jgi:hypothetical protein
MNSNSNSSSASGGNPKDFKTFLETEYSQTILEQEVDFNMFKPYKSTIYPYLYRILKNVFTGFDNSSPVPITLPYSFFYNLTPEKFEDLREDEAEGVIKETKTKLEIAIKRLYKIYYYEGAFNGFEEDGDWDYLYQLKNIVLFVLYNDENYKSEIDYNPLEIPEGFPKLKFGISLCSYHSSFEENKVKKYVDESTEESFEMLGQHFMMAPLGKKCHTFYGDDYLKYALTFIFLNGENPLTKELKKMIRDKFNKTFQNKYVLSTDKADEVEFSIPNETPTHSQQEYIDYTVEQNRNEANYMKSMAKSSDLAYKQVTKPVAMSKIYYGSHKGQSPYMWGTFSYPVFDASFIPYLNKCLSSPITTKEEYDELVEKNIFSFDNDDGSLFKLQKKYGETRIPFTYEMFKHFVRQYGDEQTQKLFCCLFWNRTAGDEDKILDDYILPSNIVHQLLSLVYNSYKLLDTSCNHDSDNPDSSVLDFLKFTIPSAANSQQDFLPEVRTFDQTLETFDEDDEDSPFSIEKKPTVNLEEKGGTRKIKKRNKKGKKTRKLKKRTKKMKKRTKKTKKLKKMK